MRPDIDDILSGVQRLLQSEFVPALMQSAPFLAEQAMYATLVLEYCKKTWPRLHLVLAEEHGDLNATLAIAVDHLAGDDAGHALATAIRAELSGDVTSVATSTLDVLARRNESLRALVSRVVELLDARVEAAAGTPLAAARASTDAYLARHAARQYAELQALGLNW